VALTIRPGRAEVASPIYVRASRERWGIGLVDRGICRLAKKLRENKRAPNDLLE